jgi:protein-L-isoaspartate(D-aspartate) O-methyltransferase
MNPHTVLTSCCLLVALGAIPPAAAPTDDPQAAARAAMVALIRAEVRATRHELGRETLDARVLDALGRVPRHEFVPRAQRAHAYDNRPLPIGYGQTISQPYIVAIMTELLALEPGARVLEIGTGSGYQAAILHALGARTYTIEIIPALAATAAERLQRLGHGAVRTRTGDGYDGWPQAAPFDAIIVTAAANHIPPPLLEQLKPGGRMVIPLGQPFRPQQLLLVNKDNTGHITTRKILPVQFVPLTGRQETITPP